MPIRILLLCALPLAACAGAEKSQGKPSSPPVVEAEPTAVAGDAPTEPNETDDAKTQCVAVYVRQRECTSDFIPALVDARIRLNRPEGIAERAGSEGRDAILGEAMSEWAVDSEDANIDASCDQIISTVHDDALISVMAATSACLDESDCARFASCIVPAIENLLK